MKGRKSKSVVTSTDYESTPRRSTRRLKQIYQSTPVKSKSSEVRTRVTSPSSQKIQQISKKQSSYNKSKAFKRRRRQIIKKKKKTSIKRNDIQTERRGGRRRKAEDAILTQQSTTEQPQRCRPRFNLEKSSAGEQDDSLPSSDLSIELSVHEEPLSHLSSLEDEDIEREEEEEELPSFLMVDTKSSSIKKGGFVWYKFRNFPFWPAVVKSVNHKIKRASILFVDEQLIQQKRGFLVALKTLKPYQCDEFDELISKAKEKYNRAIQWAIELIEDYIMRKGLGSFSGSFIEYYAHDMSYPVRRKYQTSPERPTIASDVIEESLPIDLLDDSVVEQQKEDVKSLKRLLPDRTRAAHNRANEKLVYFIVKQRMVDEHLLAVMRRQKPSRWLCSFLNNNNRKRVVNIYLEDDEQLDQVYRYLSELYTTAAETDNCLINQVSFVLDVLLPEAIIYAIAGVHNMSVKKAEDMYLKGRRISNREREEFYLMIEQQMKTQPFTSAFALFSETS